MTRTIIGTRSDGAIHTSVTSKTAACTINAMAMVVAVVGTGTQVASSTLVARETMAGAIVTIAFVVTIRRAFHQRAIKSSETVFAAASHICRTDTVTGAIVRAHACFTFYALITSFTHAKSILAKTVVIAITWARF